MTRHQLLANPLRPEYMHRAVALWADPVCDEGDRDRCVPEAPAPRRAEQSPAPPCSHIQLPHSREPEFPGTTLGAAAWARNSWEAGSSIDVQGQNLAQGECACAAGGFVRMSPLGHRITPRSAGHRSGRPIVDETGREWSRSCRADPLAISVQFCWPPALRNLAVCVQNLVAADTRAVSSVSVTREVGHHRVHILVTASHPTGAWTTPGPGTCRWIPHSQGHKWAAPYRPSDCRDDRI
jgi:hypothetical protein